MFHDQDEPEISTHKPLNNHPFVATMASITTQLSVPDGFPDLLRDFTRELLRAQPENMYEFGAQYFGERSGGATSSNKEPLILDLPALKARIEGMFAAADQGQKGFLSAVEAHDLIATLGPEFNLTESDVQYIMAEADADHNGQIEFGEFIPLALEVFESLYAKTEVHRQQEMALMEAEELLLHGLSQEELENTLFGYFKEADSDDNGTLDRAEFKKVLKDSGMGFTRKELNSIMIQVDVNNDDVISYQEFVPVALALCRDILARDLVANKLPTQEAEAAEFIMQLFENLDVQNNEVATGYLPTEQLGPCLTSADLGLSRVQINAIVSEARADEEGMVQYADFAVVASSMFVQIFKFRVAENSS
jgi:Ca2+-binding EF-hand superfamily protein